MAHTNLLLGANWHANEWPESVDVMHEVARDSLKYVPERTCAVTAYTDYGPHAEDCTIVFSCGHETLGYIPNYCPSCGAKVVN